VSEPLDSEWLQQSWAEGRRAWPGVELSLDDFARRLGAILPRPLHTSDLYVACACAQGNQAAMEALDRTLIRHAAKIIARIDPSADFVDEISQRLRQRLFLGQRPRIGEYRGLGPLANWVNVAAYRVALNALRGRGRPAAAPLPVPVITPEGALIDDQHGRALKLAVLEALDDLDPAHRELVKLHYLNGLSLVDIGRRLGVDRSTASRRLALARRALVDEVRRRVALSIPDTSADSIRAWIERMSGQLDLGLE
jgi:RNA polymerase sigma-70 factor (ECF subfamily)